MKRVNSKVELKVSWHISVDSFKIFKNIEVFNKRDIKIKTHKDEYKKGKKEPKQSITQTKKNKVVFWLKIFL